MRHSSTSPSRSTTAPGVPVEITSPGDLFMTWQDEPCPTPDTPRNRVNGTLGGAQYPIHALLELTVGDRVCHGLDPAQPDALLVQKLAVDLSGR